MTQLIPILEKTVSPGKIFARNFSLFFSKFVSLKIGNGNFPCFAVDRHRLSLLLLLLE